MNAFQWIYLAGLLVFWVPGCLHLTRKDDATAGWFMLAGLLWPLFLLLYIAITIGDYRARARTPRP